MRRLVYLAAAAALTLTAAPAVAVSLIGFTDNNPQAATSGLLSDTSANWVVAWTQAQATSNVTVRALLDTNVGPVPGNWWITNALGPGTDMSNVIASGSYIAPDLPTPFDFNPAPRTTLATGLSFAAGTYFLVLDGPAGPFLNNAQWYGGNSTNTTVTLASGFSLGGYRSTGSPAAFGPAATFENDVSTVRLVFELDGNLGPAVPEPATWAMMITGLGFAGAAARRRKGSNWEATSIR